MDGQTNFDSIINANLTTSLAIKADKNVGNLETYIYADEVLFQNLRISKNVYMEQGYIQGGALSNVDIINPTIRLNSGNNNLDNVHDIGFEFLVGDSYKYMMLYNYDSNVMKMGNYEQGFKDLMSSLTPGSGIRNSLSNNDAIDLYTSNQTRVHITKDGKVGINTSHPTSTLSVNGNIYVSGTVLSISDCNVKYDIARIRDAHDRLEKISGYTYKKNNCCSPSPTTNMGVIAQELLKSVPEAVSCMGENLSVDYNALIALLVECVKENKREIETLKISMSNILEREQSQRERSE